MNDRDALADYLAQHDARCPICQYRLHGLTTDRCPECGDTLRLGVVGDVDTRLGPLLVVLLPATAAFTSGVYWLLFIAQDFANDPFNVVYGPVDFLLTFALLLAVIPLTLGLALRRPFQRLPTARQWQLARLAAAFCGVLIAVDLTYNLFWY